MKTIAKLQAEEAADLSERLKGEGIPNTMQAIAHDGELDMSELWVEDIAYERACATAELWQTERLADAEKRCHWSCPHCKSRRLECVPNDKIEYLFRCKDCDNKFILLGPPPGNPPEKTPIRTGSSAPQSTISGPSLNLTIFIVCLTVAAYLLGWLATHLTRAHSLTLFWAYFLAAIVCLERGQYILKRDRLLGWLCIVVGIVQLVLVGIVIVRHWLVLHALI